MKWLEDRLDIKQQLPTNKAADNLNLIQCVRYRIKTGLKVTANKAFHLPGKEILSVLSQLITLIGIINILVLII